MDEQESFDRDPDPKYMQDLESEAELQELIKQRQMLDEKITTIRKHSRSRSPKARKRKGVEFQGSEMGDIPEGPTKSELDEQEYEQRARHRPLSKDSVDSVVLPNPLLGRSEGEIIRKRNKEEWSEYVWKGVKEED